MNTKDSNPWEGSGTLAELLLSVHYAGCLTMSIAITGYRSFADELESERWFVEQGILRQVMTVAVVPF